MKKARRCAKANGPNPNIMVNCTLQRDLPSRRAFTVSEAIPVELKQRAHWVLWRNVQRASGPTKVPYQANGSRADVSDPLTWLPFEAAWSAYIANREHYAGIGFVFSPDDPYCGIDLDACMDPVSGEITDWAREILREVPSYTERSPSGCGLKLFVRGQLSLAPGKSGATYRKLPPHPAARGKKAEVAVWRTRRYFAVTGNVYDERLQIADCQHGLDALCGRYWRHIGQTPPECTAAGQTELDRSQVHAGALGAMVRSTAKQRDNEDGSRRLITCACRCVEFDLSDDEAVATINEYAQRRPFPRRWTDKEMLTRVRHAEQMCQRGSSAAAELPQVVLPGGGQPINVAAHEFGSLLARPLKHFVRDGVVVCLVDEQAPRLRPLKATELASEIEAVAVLVRAVNSNQATSYAPATCNKATAELILAAGPFIAALPTLKVLSPCPILVDRGGQLVEVTGYDAHSGVRATGRSPDRMSLPEARGLLDELMAGFQFASDSDRSRALAAIITPALVFGGLLSGRAPIDLGEADQSQTGKGYRNKITAAIYGGKPYAVTQRNGGVGSLEESFDHGLIEGQPFIALDNVRGKVASQAIESFATEDRYAARTPYRPVAMIDPRGSVVMITSNKAEMTEDLANRCSCVRLLKQPRGYQFTRYPEGDLLEHVRANQPRFLGAVFAVIRAWHEAGRRRTAENRHDFREWTQVLDWICRELLCAAPLMEGHRGAQQRMSSPDLTWLHGVAAVVRRARRIDEALTATQLVELLVADGSVEIPSLGDGDIEEESVHTNVVRQLGRKMSRFFRDGEVVTVEGMSLERRSYRDEHSRERCRYAFNVNFPRARGQRPTANP